jgi:hypothetical protein
MLKDVDTMHSKVMMNKEKRCGEMGCERVGSYAAEFLSVCKYLRILGKRKMRRILPRILIFCVHYFQRKHLFSVFI